MKNELNQLRSIIIFKLSYFPILLLAVSTPLIGRPEEGGGGGILEATPWGEGLLNTL